MYGVPTNLPLFAFVGQSCTLIRLGEYQLQFHFGAAHIDVEGDWEWRAPSAATLDCSMPNSERAVYHIHKMLGLTVSSVYISPPDWISLTFQDGSTLIVYDNYDKYESFAVFANGEDHYI